ncbi:hypothetical protein [Ruegeria sp. HKCCA4707]|uniref:hypothetical protein n=1 Tax=Ruegeria sp. HKCCA4707 TaxID=2682984 RepID=UPI001489F067|nr:hypothetical protein [Ruegeria sp. HKCCA4707]
MSDVKTCTKCGETKSLTEFHRDKNRPDGLTGACKACRTASSKKWQSKNLERAYENNKRYRDRLAPVRALVAAEAAALRKIGRRQRALIRTEKKCPSCELVLPIEDFGINVTTLDGRNCYCLPCAAEYNRSRGPRNVSNGKRLTYSELSEEHRTRLRAKQRRWFKNLDREERDKINQSQREARKNNPERLASARASCRNHWLKNREQYVEKKRRYEAAKLRRTPPWLTDRDIAEMRLAYSMASNLEYENGKKYEVDHITPLQGEKVSGLHVPWNLQVIPANENRSKGNKFLVGEDIA